MNDQQNPYDPYYTPQPQIIGYDEYGQPVYSQAQQSQQHQQYDPYAAPQAQQQGYGYDPYGQQQAQQHQQPQQYDPYAQQSQAQGYAPGQEQTGAGDPAQGYGYDAYTGYDTSQQWAPAPQHHQEPEPRQAPPVTRVAPAVPGQRRPAPDAPSGAPSEASPEKADDQEYRTEQFSFIEEPDEDSEDVIDWLKFTESRSERREEAKRRGRARVVALTVVLALALVGGVGYLWSAGLLPGLSDGETRQGAVASGPQKRDVIVLHLHNTKNKDTSTALLVNNATTKQGTTVLLPGSLSVANDDGTTTTLAKSVDDDGSTGTREAIGTLLGTRISGTWRLDTPYLENLVELVGGIDLTTDTEVPGAKKGEAPLVQKGENQTLNGRMAVAYATYRGSGEADAKQLQRFGQVMNGVLRKISDDPGAATVTVETLAQILDPSLPEKDLGASLANLAGHAKLGDYKTALLPVREDGTLSDEAASSVVKDVLGGSVSPPEQGAAVRVGVKNASGDEDAGGAARIVLINGGYSFIDGGKAESEPSSQVIYGDEGQKGKAEEVAKTLGLPAGSVEKGTVPANADVAVVLGQDYKAK
ncbi:LCP family protein [Streptomyces sp. SP18CS02]|uniref:LCP family protein n=1 Tax=Streptomyces sp. SP18CS02 TaxID=3002531 RepID=UPI002E771E9C|nr:LytR C-terminal domain-containing protein [Streptomyces sp. SP18CS02]MEE1753459.1 LytR C-terminal domain-containing protein [Streptomyces sp. SP18CS02]